MVRHTFSMVKSKFSMEEKQYIIQFDTADGSQVYYSRLKGDFYGTENRDHATIFKGKKYAEREADKMLEQDSYLVCYSIQEV